MAQPQAWTRRVERASYLRHLQAQRVATREIARVLRAAAIEAERLVATMAPAQGVGAQVQRAQLQALTEQLRRNQAALWGNVTRATERGISAGTLAAAEGHATMVGMLAEAGADARLAETIRQAARFSAESVRAKYLNDINLSGRVYRNSQWGIRKANEVVVRGLAQNLSARQMAGRVRHLIRPDTPGGISYASMRLARTEINNGFHATNVEMYGNSPFVEAAQWVLSGSHPMPDDCDDYSEADDYRLGQGVFLPEHVPEKPHPHCLCYTVAVTPTPEQFQQRLMAGGYDDWLSRQGFSGARTG